MEWGDHNLQKGEVNEGHTFGICVALADVQSVLGGDGFWLGGKRRHCFLCRVYPTLWFFVALVVLVVGFGFINNLVVLVKTPI